MTTRFDPIIPMARASHKKFYPFGPFVSIILAQWADESAYGTRTAGENNFFGIKATPAQIAEGRAAIVWTKEFIGSKYISEPLHFATFATPEDCFDAHGQLLISHHYLACMRAKTPQDYAIALHTCGYATEPSYSEILISIMNQNNLYQYDEAA
jgi:flagellum-specific peptidoglycan hydrolase FlgJ